MKHCDVLISGGGPAGLIAAAAFGSAGFQVICVDPTPPVTDRDAAGADLRTTAFLQPGRHMLERAGLWDELADQAVALQTMRIMDAGRSEATAPVTRDFDADELFDVPFGWNLPNWLIRRAALHRLQALETVTFYPGTATQSLFSRTSQARVTLSDGTRVQARLVLAADGRNSPMRRAAGIDVATKRYGQQALAFAVTHEAPHNNVSTEVHLSGGPFTLVPLPDDKGKPSSAVVWMDAAAHTARRATMAEDAFNAEMTERSCKVLGALELASRRTTWPIVSQLAHRLTGERLALMAEAAHVMPPIGAQGLNTSLADLTCLLDLALDRPDRLGETEMLAAYERQRLPEIRLRLTGIDLLNRMSMAGSKPLRAARALGLQAIHDVAPVRRALMSLGVGR